MKKTDEGVLMAIQRERGREREMAKAAAAAASSLVVYCM